jgi:hypothetical protein
MTERALRKSVGFNLSLPIDDIKRRKTFKGTPHKQVKDLDSDKNYKHHLSFRSEAISMSRSYLKAQTFA